MTKEPPELGPRSGPHEGWDDYRRVVLHRLDEVARDIELMRAENRADHIQTSLDIAAIKSEIASLKTKSSLFGGLAGLGAAIAVFAASLFRGHV
jgi:hypothetical protein